MEDGPEKEAPAPCGAGAGFANEYREGVLVVDVVGAQRLVDHPLEMRRGESGIVMLASQRVAVEEPLQADREPLSRWT